MNIKEVISEYNSFTTGWRNYDQRNSPCFYEGKNGMIYTDLGHISGEKGRK